MKRSDITDWQVCLAASLAHPKRTLDMLMEITGEPQAVCLAAIERAESRGLVEVGVSLATAWLTDDGHSLLEQENQRENQ